VIGEAAASRPAGFRADVANDHDVCGKCYGLSHARTAANVMIV
jgi:hypothetical protein